MEYETVKLSEKELDTAATKLVELRNARVPTFFGSPEVALANAKQEILNLVDVLNSVEHAMMESAQ